MRPTHRPTTNFPALPGPSTHHSSQLFVSSGCGHHYRQYCPRMADERRFEHANFVFAARNGHRALFSKRICLVARSCEQEKR